MEYTTEEKIEIAVNARRAAEQIRKNPRKHHNAARRLLKYWDLTQATAEI